MRYRLNFHKGMFITNEVWLNPKNGDATARQASNAALQRVLGFDKPAAAVALTPEDAETMRQMQESQWAVYIQQGIPLRDVAALRWYANVALKESLSEYKTANNVFLYVQQKVTKAAGGALPGHASSVLDEIEKTAARIALMRADRKKKGERVPVKTAGDRSSQLSTEVADAIKTAVKLAKFRHPRKAKGGSLAVGVTVLNSKSKLVDAALTDYLVTPRRKADRIQLKVRSDWSRVVGKTGLANAFGPSTLVLHAEVIPNGGTKLVVAEQGASRYAIKVSEGWLSLDKDNNRIFKKGGKV